MPGNGVSRAYLDTAGGTIQVGNPDFFLDGLPVAVQGNPVQSHGKNEHSNAVMLNGTPSFLINGIPVCTSASQASCGHQATGSSTFTVGTSSRGTESRNPGVAPQFSYTPPETPRPIWVGTWASPVSGRLNTLAAELLTDADFTTYEYVKPLIWLTAPNSSASYIDDPAQQYRTKIGTSPAYRNRMNAIVNGLNKLPEGMRALAPWYYWNGYLYYENPTKKRSDIDTFLANNPTESPGDYNTYPSDYRDGTNGIFLFNRKSDSIRGSGWTLASIWGATAVNQVYQDWKVMCSLLKTRGANIDYLVFDSEGFPGNGFTDYPVGQRQAAFQAMESSPLAQQEWYGARPLLTVLKQDGKYPTNSAAQVAADQHPQRSPSYIYWNGGLASIRNASMTYCFYETAKELYPEIGLSNYESFKVNDKDWAYDPYGHPVFQENAVGDGSAPYLYASWNSDTAWVIDPYDDTRIIRNDTNTQTSGLPKFTNSIWNCFLLDVQLVRSIKRADSDSKLRPWIRPRGWTGDAGFKVGITAGQPTSPQSGERFYYEVVRHACVSGAEHFYWWNTPNSDPATDPSYLQRDCEEMNAIITEANDLLGGFSPEVVTKSRISFKTDYVVSGTKAAGGDNAGKYVWRITPKPGLTLISETGRPLTVDSDGGAWLVTSSVIIPKYSVQ